MYIVHVNKPGCLPDGDSPVFYTLHEAREYMIDLVVGYNSGWAAYTDGRAIIVTPAKYITARDIRLYTPFNIEYARIGAYSVNVGHISEQMAIEQGYIE